MKNKQIREFLTKVAQDEKFKAEIEKFNKKVEAKTLTEKNGKDFINKVVLPAAKKLGYKFTMEDLAEFFASQEGANLASLSPEDLENVSGGVFPFAAMAVSALIGMFGVGAGSVAVANYFSNTAVEARQVAVVDIIDEMLQTLNSAKVHWDIDNMDQATKVKFLAQLKTVIEKIKQENVESYYIAATENDKGYGIPSVSNPRSAYERKVLLALVRLNQSYQESGVESKLTVPDLNRIFGDDYQELANKFTFYGDVVDVRTRVDNLFNTINDETIRWDVRNIGKEQREEFKQNLATMMKLVEWDKDDVYSIPWGSGYGGTEYPDESPKLRALFELKTAIDNQKRGVEAKLEKETLNNIFGGKYTEIIEAKPTWKTCVEKVVENLNDSNVDWNLERLSEDTRNEVLNQLGTICSNIKKGPKGLHIPACGIDEGYGANSDEQGILRLLLALRHRSIMKDYVAQDPTEAMTAYYEVEDDADLTDLVRSEILLYLSSDAYKDSKVRDLKAVNRFIRDRAKLDPKLKENKDAQGAIRSYLMSDNARDLTSDDLMRINTVKQGWIPELTRTDLQRLLGQDLALKLSQAQQNRRAKGLAELAGKLAEQKKAQDAKAADLEQAEKTHQRAVAELVQREEKVESAERKVSQMQSDLINDRDNFEDEKKVYNAEHKNRMQEVKEEKARNLAEFNAMKAELRATYMQKEQKLENEYDELVAQLKQESDEGRKQLNAKLDELEMKMKELDDEKDKYEEEFAKKTKELEDKDEQQYQDWFAEFARLNDREEEQNAKEKELAEQKVALELQNKQIDKTHDSLRDWHSRLQKQKAQQDALSQYLDNKIAQEEQLERDARAATEELSNMQDKLAGITKELKRLKDECAQKDSRILTLTRQLATASNTDAPPEFFNQGLGQTDSVTQETVGGTSNTAKELENLM